MWLSNRFSSFFHPRFSVPGVENMLRQPRAFAKPAVFRWPEFKRSHLALTFSSRRRDLKVIADEAAKLAMRADASIGFAHLQQVAADNVPPSISRELEEAHQSFVGTG
jgi:hypothetical protein